MRQIVLDTETTGLSPTEGHRIIEVGCVELINRQRTGNDFHQYINPEREIDAGAQAVHGITTDFLSDKPTFQGISDSLGEYLQTAELIIHNASFDLGFLNHEFTLLDADHIKLEARASIIDTLKLARSKHMGQRNNLDALCKRYHINASQRDLHGALLDAELLAEVYLAMTGGQIDLFGEISPLPTQASRPKPNQKDPQPSSALPSITPHAQELSLHQNFLETIAKASNQRCIWLAD